jgi:hypothetical protein
MIDVRLGTIEGTQTYIDHGQTRFQAANAVPSYLPRINRLIGTMTLTGLTGHLGPQAT